jgi:hypothetical protein
MNYLNEVNKMMDFDFDCCEVVEERDESVIVECGVFGCDEVYEFELKKV